MIGFLVGAAFLLALGAGVLLWPLLRGDHGAQGRTADAIVDLFREKLRELEAERASGAIADEQYEKSRRDLERQLLDAVAVTNAPAAAGPRRARWTAALVGVFAVFVPILLYINLGTPEALVPGAIRPAGAADEAQAENAAGGKRGAPRP